MFRGALLVCELAIYRWGVAGKRNFGIVSEEKTHKDWLRLVEFARNL